MNSFQDKFLALRQEYPVFVYRSFACRQEGDSLYIDSSKPHRWKNAGEKKMVVLAALIPSKSWPPLADY